MDPIDRRLDHFDGIFFVNTQGLNILIIRLYELVIAFSIISRNAPFNISSVGIFFVFLPRAVILVHLELRFA